MYKIWFLILLLFVTIPLRAEEESSNKIKVFVSILPQVYFVERIGGSNVEVDVLVLPGESPATYNPTPKQMINLSKAQVYFRIGVSFENSIIPVIINTMKNVKVIDTRKDIQLRKITEHHHDGLAEEDDHHEEGSDPHIWMSPPLVKIQAKTIRDTLITLDPNSKTYYEDNYKSFAEDLDNLDKYIRQVFAPLKGHEFFVFHPAYGYFADAYGLKQVAVESGGKEPNPKHLAQLIKMAKEQDVKVIFVQKQFSRESAAAIADAIGGAVVILDPLEKDYIRNLKEMAGKIENALIK